MITRLAPTPSGYLHAGNAAHFLVVQRTAARLDCDIALRIDDMDAARYRDEFARDIFDVVTWLDVPWSVGPRTMNEFTDRASLVERRATYWAAIESLRNAGAPTFVCRCSRTSTQCHCRDHDYRLKIGESALKLELDGSDTVLWRRDDLPAYTLTSVVDDARLGVTHVIRGEDLRAVEHRQRELARWLTASNVVDAEYLYHPLVLDDRGEKLSKSTLRAGPLPRTDEMRAAIEAMADELTERCR